MSNEGRSLFDSICYAFNEGANSTQRSRLTLVCLIIDAEETCV